MSIETQLREELRKIVAMFAGAGMAGDAAEAALERRRGRLAELGSRCPPNESNSLCQIAG